MKWINIENKLPPSHHFCYIKYVYENGYEGRAIAIYYEDLKEWEVFWSDDHAQQKDIKCWLDED